MTAFLGDSFVIESLRDSTAFRIQTPPNIRETTNTEQLGHKIVAPAVHCLAASPLFDSSVVSYILSEYTNSAFRFALPAMRKASREELPRERRGHAAVSGARVER